MWLINQDERKKFISSIIEEMATPFLDKNKRPDSFYWEYLFEFEIPEQLLSSISSSFLEIIRSQNENIKLLINKSDVTFSKVDKLFIEEKQIEFFEKNGIKQYRFQDFDDLIEKWHNKEDDSIHLHTFLGLTWRQYQKLLECKKIYN